MESQELLNDQIFDSVKNALIGISDDNDEITAEMLMSICTGKLTSPEIEKLGLDSNVVEQLQEAFTKGQEIAAQLEMNDVDAVYEAIKAEKEMLKKENVELKKEIRKLKKIERDLREDLSFDN